MMVDIIIVGGGASGLMAALSASEDRQRQVVVLERQARVGRKLLQTGNGRCNLSNSMAEETHYHGEEPQFVVPALEAFSVEDTLAFFRSLGLLTVEEYGGRIYPLSNQANSVLDVLRLELESRKNVQLQCAAGVEGVARTSEGFAVNREGARMTCAQLIVACGGCAGTKVGGVMDGYKLLAALGHTRTALYPSLTQVRTVSAYPKALKGVRAEAEVRVLRRGKCVAVNRGEVLFTETGVSGTAIFELSREVSAGGSEQTLCFDFLQAYTAGELEQMLAQTCARRPDGPGNGVLTGTVHNRLGQMLCKYAGVGQDTAAGALTSGQIRAIVGACKAFPLEVTGVSGFESAQVTAGGIRTKEFDAQTLQSRIVPGLYACGEVLDIDGDCGGYNLQWAWSSGRLAGRLKK